MNKQNLHLTTDRGEKKLTKFCAVFHLGLWLNLILAGVS